MTLRRGFALDPGEPVVVVEDVITTGGSTREVMEAVRAPRGAGAGRGQPGRPQRRGGGPRRARAQPARARGAHLRRRGLPAVRAGLDAGEARARARRALSGAVCRSTASRSPTTAPTSSAGSSSARGGRTVQGVLEEALARLAGGTRVVGGRGRAHRRRGPRPRPGGLVRPARARSSPAALRRALNGLLPGGRAGARGASGRPPGFHARRSAVSKLYRYVLDCGGVQLPAAPPLRGLRAPPPGRGRGARGRRALRRPPRLRLARLLRRLGDDQRPDGDALRGRLRRARASSTRSRPTASCARWCAAWSAGSIAAGRGALTPDELAARSRGPRPRAWPAPAAGPRPHPRARRLPGRDAVLG